jgi:hypothetical protein
MDINNVIDAWNEQADGFNQWDDLGADEQVEFALKLCQSPQAAREAGSDAVALLSGIDDIVSKIRSEEYRAKCGYKRGNGCLMKNPTFPMHTCDGLSRCRYEGQARAPKSPQLKLSIPQLQAMGFISRFCPEVITEDSHSSEKTVYEINCLNGVFGYDPTSDEAYRWYQCITIGKSCNHISLDIHNLRSLYTTLRVFKVDHAEVKI